MWCVRLICSGICQGIAGSLQSVTSLGAAGADAAEKPQNVTPRARIPPPFSLPLRVCNEIVTTLCQQAAVVLIQLRQQMSDWNYVAPGPAPAARSLNKHIIATWLKSFSSSACCCLSEFIQSAAQFQRLSLVRLLFSLFFLSSPFFFSLVLFFTKQLANLGVPVCLNQVGFFLIWFEDDG